MSWRTPSLSSLKFRTLFCTIRRFRTFISVPLDISTRSDPLNKNFPESFAAFTGWKINLNLWLKDKILLVFDQTKQHLIKEIKVFDDFFSWNWHLSPDILLSQIIFLSAKCYDCQWKWLNRVIFLSWFKLQYIVSLHASRSCVWH